tara:strand:- start:640 stop:804 length:165 start_codon:yes stop_codon:yes gene_type:complete
MTESQAIKKAIAHETHGRKLFGQFLIGALSVADPKLLERIAKNFLTVEKELKND